MVVRVVFCPRCGGKMMVGSSCSQCAEDAKTGKVRKSRSSHSDSPSAKGPIITFLLVLVGLYVWAEVLLATKGPTPPLFLLVGAMLIMCLWKVGYWYEDGESVFNHLMLRAIFTETLGFFLSPSKIIWFWTTERPYFRACTIASWLSLIVFYVIHFGLYAATKT